MSSLKERNKFTYYYVKECFCHFAALFMHVNLLQMVGYTERILHGDVCYEWAGLYH